MVGNMGGQAKGCKGSDIFSFCVYFHCVCVGGGVEVEWGGCLIR